MIPNANDDIEVGLHGKGHIWLGRLWHRAMFGWGNDGLGKDYGKQCVVKKKKKSGEKQFGFDVHIGWMTV